MTLVAATDLAWIPVWMAGIALGTALLSFLGTVLTAVMQYATRRAVEANSTKVDATSTKVDEAAVKREEVAKVADDKMEKVIADVKKVHEVANSLSDKRARESEDAGIQEGVNRERERADKQALAVNGATTAMKAEVDKAVQIAVDKKIG